MRPRAESIHEDSSAAADEAALVAKLRAGDEAAFEELVRRYGGRMLAVAQRILGDEQQAADAVQEGYLSLLRALDRFDGRSRIATWLHRIVVNAALMRLRSRRRREEVAVEPLLPTFAADGHRVGVRPAWTGDGAALLERRETRELVREAIAQLPEEYRDVVILRDIQGLDTAETAVVLGATPGAIKTRLHRARMALRELLERALEARGELTRE